MIGKGFAHNDTRFDAIESRLGKIENLLIEDQRRKIENLEIRMKKTRRRPRCVATRQYPPCPGGFCISKRSIPTLAG